jgi:hypothetical protein
MAWTYVPAQTEEVFEYLKRAAREMRTVTYGEIAADTGLAAPGTGFPLGYVRDEVCRARGLPWLTAIAVNAGTKLPGGSFFPDGAGLSADLESDDLRIWWRAMVLQVFATDWSAVELQPPADL